MTLLTMRLTGVVLLTAALLLTLRRRGADLGVTARDLPVLLVDRRGRRRGQRGVRGCRRGSGLVSVAAVLASLYPVVTALLAYRFLGERLRRIQVVGVGDHAGRRPAARSRPELGGLRRRPDERGVLERWRQHAVVDAEAAHGAAQLAAVGAVPVLARGLLEHLRRPGTLRTSGSASASLTSSFCR